MNTSWFHIAVRNTATSSILGYQRFISPHKGFACAYRVLHRERSCSEYAKQAIAQKGFFAALPLIRQRFQACKQASQILKGRCYRVSNHSQSEEESSTPPKKQPSDRGGYTPVNQCQDNALNGIFECGTGCCSSEEWMGSCARADCGDCTPELDCSSVNCGDCTSGLDCSSATCGDCGDCSGADCCSWG